MEKEGEANGKVANLNTNLQIFKGLRKYSNEDMDKA